MSDCLNHKKELFGQTDMKIVAEAIGDLHYETLQELLGRLATKLYTDGLQDRMNGREKLGRNLNDAADEISFAAYYVKEAWQISKPFMKDVAPQ